LPVLDGAAKPAPRDGQFAAAGKRAAARARCVDGAQAAAHTAYPLFFDPQTAGGLLAAVPAGRADDCRSALRALGYDSAMCIGDVRPAGDASARVWLTA
jgi:selenide,water dikinase